MKEMNKRTVKKMDNSGFTLIEVVISIAALSVAAVVFLQVFVKANQVIEKTDKTNQAMLVATNQLEKLKGCSSLEDYCNQTEDKPSEKEMLLFGQTVLLDDEFRIIKSQSNEELGVYRLRLVFDKEGTERIEELYKVTVKVVEIESKVDLVEFETYYFSGQ